MNLESYNCVCVCFFFLFFSFIGIHIQLAGPITEICLNIQKLAGNRSNDKETSASGMSLSKAPFLNIWGCKRAFILCL